MDRERPRRARRGLAAARRPRARRRRRRPHARGAARRGARRLGARSGVRMRHPGPAAEPACGAGRGDRHLRPRAVVHVAQRRAERGRRASRPGSGACSTRWPARSSSGSPRIPPFVITPRVEGVPVYEYRDGGLEGDDLMAAVVGTVGEHLAPGGVATLLGNWEARGGATGTRPGARLGRRLARAPGCMGHRAGAAGPSTVRRGVGARRRHASGIARTYDGLIGAWLDDFDRRGVTGGGPRVGAAPPPGRRARPWPATKRSDPPRAPSRDSSPRPSPRTIGWWRWMTTGSPHPLCSSRPDVTEARHHLPGRGGPERHRAAAGWRARPHARGRLGARRRRRARATASCRVGVLVDAVAQLLEVDPVALRADVLPRVRELVFTGFLGFA